MKKLSPRMDKNLKMGPRADEKSEKRNPERTKSPEKWDLKSVGPPSPSPRGDPRGCSFDIFIRTRFLHSIALFYNLQQFFSSLGITGQNNLTSCQEYHKFGKL